LLKFLALILAFTTGLVVARVLPQSKVKIEPATDESLETEAVRQAAKNSWQESTPSADGSGLNSKDAAVSDTKLTIKEVRGITADKQKAETGEQVNFSARIKNIGSKKKHLTHLCFNHSGGVTFGCTNGPNGFNLDPGQEIDISNSMMFVTPGAYSVWLTWSQDKTNFLKPLDSSLAQVTIN